jgi:uncharacterized membrane protein
MSGVPHQPQGAAFDVVLLLHVACVVVGLVTTVASAATASRLRRLLGAGTPIPDAVARYFRPGVNWAGRSIYGIPIFGFALVAMSHGAYALGQGWVAAGLAIFVVVALVTEGALWPAERRLQQSLAPHAGRGDPTSVPTPAPMTPPAVPPMVQGEAQAMARSATLALVLLIAGTVIMVAQP